ncbi:MAG: hypothetical protein V3U88_01960 [Methylococcales bacterium]
MPSKRILIITSGSSIRNSLLKWMIQYWRESGHNVELVSDINTSWNADIALLHFDATDVPLTYINFVRKFPIAINGRAKNISKTFFSNQIIKKNSDYYGMVIVKTVANAGGLPELHAENYPKIRKKFIKFIGRITSSGKLQNKYIESFLWRKVRVLDASNYPMYLSPQHVPNGVWHNRRMVVEKYLPEQTDDGRYRLRHWYFFGDMEFSRTLISSEPIVKWIRMNDGEKHQSRKEWVGKKSSKDCQIPKAVREVRKKLGLDYGRIDWALHHGKPVVYDVNKTPFGFGEISVTAEYALKNEVIREFSQGINYFI